MTIINPSDDIEAKAAVKATFEMEGPVYLRFGRLAVPVITTETITNLKSVRVLC